MTVIKLKCKMAEEDVRDVNGLPLACKDCTGVIEVETDESGKVLHVHLTIKNMRTLPRKPFAKIDCPALLEDPREGLKKGLVEVVR